MWCQNRTQIDELAAEIALYDRAGLIHRILHFSSRTSLDFTNTYLDELPTDRLRHILMCAMSYLPPK